MYFQLTQTSLECKEIKDFSKHKYMLNNSRYTVQCISLLNLLFICLGNIARIHTYSGMKGIYYYYQQKYLTNHRKGVKIESVALKTIFDNEDAVHIHKAYFYSSSLYQYLSPDLYFTVPEI